MRPVSDRRRAENIEYEALRVRLLTPQEMRGVAYPPICQAGLRFRRAGFPRLANRCTGIATELHHLRKRSSAGALANPENVLPVCSACNLTVEDHPEEARKAGLVVREGDSQWDALSSRAWRKNHG